MFTGGQRGRSTWISRAIMERKEMKRNERSHLELRRVEAIRAEGTKSKSGRGPVAGTYLHVVPSPSFASVHIGRRSPSIYICPPPDRSPTSMSYSCIGCRHVQFPISSFAACLFHASPPDSRPWPSFSLHPRPVFHPTQSSSYDVSHILLSRPFPYRLVRNLVPPRDRSY